MNFEPSHTAHTRDSPLSHAPITAAAFLAPFFLAAGLMLLLRDAGMQGFRYPLAAGSLVGVGVLELITGLFARENRGSALFGLRRHILGAIVSFGLSLLVGDTWLMRTAAMVMLFGMQWAGSAAVMHYSGSLDILIRYSRGYEEIGLARRMRDTVVESADYSKHAAAAWKLVHTFVVIQFAAVLIVNLSGVSISLITGLCLVASIVAHGMIRFLFAHMTDIQRQLHQGLNMPRSAVYSRAAAALIIILISLTVGLIVSPGLSIFPPGTIARWLTRTTRFTDMPDPAALRWDSYFGAREPSELLEGLEHGDPSRFFLILLRVVAAAGLGAIIIMVAKPLVLTSFYQSIRQFHPLRRLTGALRLFFQGLIATLLELLNLAHPAAARHISGSRLPPPLQAILTSDKVSRKKQRERNQVVRAFISLIKAAESAGVSYRSHEGPGEFLVRSGRKFADIDDELPSNIRDRLNQVFYAENPLPEGDLPAMLGDMKRLRSRLQQAAAAQETEN